MLSTKPIQSASRARQYFYEKDNYYFKDSPDAKAQSQWYGKGANELGLSGQVEPEQFERVLGGELPNGVVLGKRIDGERRHRPGYDLTFSAPKSVSLLALVGGDERLIEAHQAAVKTALDQVEMRCAEARQFQDGQMHYRKTGNLVFATFLQDLSRALDPQLHTHCATMNTTLRQDGKWRALASQMGEGPEVRGFWERVHRDQRFLGLIYRSELAYRAKQLGYEIVKRDKGLWEIAGVDDADLTFFSKRRQDIEALMKERGLQGARAAAYATLVTRQDKAPAERSELKAHWQALAKTDFVQLIETRHEQGIPQLALRNGPDKLQSKVPDPVIPEAAHHSVQYAIEHLSERRLAISHSELATVALQAVLGEAVTVESIFNAIKAALAQGTLLPLPSQGEPCFTSPILLQYERPLLKHLAAAIDGLIDASWDQKA